MATQKWSFLKPGDLIDLVAPGSACSQSELEASLAELEKWGFRARVPKNIFSGHPILANDDSVRFAQLKSAFYAEDSQAIWCVRGGYGSIRLLPMMQKLKKPKRTKVLLGYSDITTLHHFVQSHWGWASLHSPLFDRLGSGKMSEQDKRDFFKLLEGRKTEVKFAGLKPLNRAAKKSQKIEAPIVGGNLCVWASTLGTAEQASAAGAFLFLEDIGERPHRVDRMLEQLKQAGAFKKCRGVLLGDFLLESHDKDLLWKDVFQRFAESVSFPVWKGLPVGHGPIQKTLPLGVQAVLKSTSQSAQLTVASGGR